jgi:ABC-type phosphate transport system substrate-binding protein
MVTSDTLVKQIVSQAPNAIGFVDAANVDGSVKVLRIAGRLPGQSGYLLSSVED